MIRRNLLTVACAWVLLLSGLVFGEIGRGETIAQLLDAYNREDTGTGRISILKTLAEREPRTRDDAKQLRKVLTRKEWDEDLFTAAMHSFRRISDRKLDGVLIDVLKADLGFLSKAARGDFQGRSAQEYKLRSLNAESAIKKLGDFRSPDAVQVLRGYLSVQGVQYAASEALAKVQETSPAAEKPNSPSVMDEVKDQAYSGGDINYAGGGLGQALTVIRDIQDESQSRNWKKMAKQIILIRHPGAKPYLRTLFLTHREDYVRDQAAIAFQNMAHKEDIPVLLEMTKSRDWFVRTSAIHAMQRISDPSLEDVLMEMLSSDVDESPRRNAAKALGYKKVARAVPVLEQALHDRDFGVRRQAFVALYVLTGQKYDFAGRDQVSDMIAEQQKRATTFY